MKRKTCNAVREGRTSFGRQTAPNFVCLGRSKHGSLQLRWLGERARSSSFFDLPKKLRQWPVSVRESPTGFGSSIWDLFFSIPSSDNAVPQRVPLNSTGMPGARWFERQPRELRGATYLPVRGGRHGGRRSRALTIARSIVHCRDNDLAIELGRQVRIVRHSNFVIDVG